MTMVLRVRAHDLDALERTWMARENPDLPSLYQHFNGGISISCGQSYMHGCTNSCQTISYEDFLSSVMMILGEQEPQKLSTEDSKGNIFRLRGFF
jgi:hypothetical protein